MTAGMKTVGEVLVDLLEANGVEVVFGIPGVHTVELYRGLASSKIRHVTPRHEQGAGFMADGYARVSGKPGVALVITGPGLTNTITAMAQARQDSIPMLVISGVNRRDSLGHGRGLLHELPDQHGMMKTLALYSQTLLNPTDLPLVVDRAFAVLFSGRPGPVHIEIPTDVMALRIESKPARPAAATRPRSDSETLQKAAILCSEAAQPVIICGGGALTAEAEVRQLAELIGAPVVTTVNARGMLAGHPLRVPASPSLKAVRALLRAADLVLALGTEMGQTDYDLYADGGFPELRNLIRTDIDAAQLARGPQAALSILSGAKMATAGILGFLPGHVAAKDGAERAEMARKAALKELSAKMRAEGAIIDMIYGALPDCAIVGDSTQAVYAGNLYCDAPRQRSWFNSATGYGALGYAPPAAVGAAVADRGKPVVCLVGDGGFQFSLAEIGSAVDAAARVIFLVWNNDGYQEIESYMVDSGITPEGVKPSAPDFLMTAGAYGVPAERLADVRDLSRALTVAAARSGPSLIEIHEAKTVGVTA
ncbi:MULTISPECIES: 5-guanidino-2-oxopentanoate decarboxylase [unclassified Sinorhizobium]|uniref:5-guanidino-2-oxopentanoate decarboxylase n=1 Tax=unclassified Sinorhizobium TaxID=2613772 RepID=UPI0024C31EAF|nr:MULTISPECIES: 5-guanidino-2-oxopentanoate decarboxylase [unclassified Sinorhizobium]MDK1377726.1 5-guanidino-2-oxopentanoate decarboxylase [Sinorhizobium sp. 6-70]MDK1478686.1 5-guanidino-2-oxopentanoate decarboxylase [Sinorhizobium sp. 6-117]